MAHADPSTNNGTNPGEGGFSNLDEGSQVEYPGSIELSAESIIAMAQTIGVNLSEDIASAVGELTIRKLRYATLLALEFSDHGNSPGLRVSDFAHAEEILNFKSYGHQSSFPPSTLKPIGLARVSVFDEGPEIDLLATLSSSKVSELIVEDLDPTFLITHPSLTTSTDTILEPEEPEPCDDEQPEQPENSAINSSLELHEIPLFDTEYDEVTEELVNDDNLKNSDSTVNPSSPDTLSENDDSRYKIRISSNCFENPMENHVDEDLKDMKAEKDPRTFTNYDEELEPEVNDIAESLQKEGMDISNYLREVELQQQLSFDIEWIKYIKVFIASFLNDSRLERDPCESELVTEMDDDDDDEDNQINETEENSDDEETDFDSFGSILKDLEKHGVHPVLEVICDFFRDYIRGLIVPISVIGLRRIVSVIKAFFVRPSALSVLQMSTLSSVLIEIFILAPPCEIQQYLSHVFMQVLKRNDELLTWACTYITEVLKKTLEMPADDISETYKSVIHGALCLTNGLETLKIQVAQEFGWHTSIVTFSKRHCQEVCDVIPSVADGYLQEQILLFCRNFLLNYKRLVSSIEMERIHNSLKDVFGEKIIPYLCRQESFTSRNSKFRKSPIKSPETLASHNNASTASKNRSIIIRKGYYKNKKVIVPYKSLISSGLL